MSFFPVRVYILVFFLCIVDSLVAVRDVLPSSFSDDMERVQCRGFGLSAW